MKKSFDIFLRLVGALTLLFIAIALFNRGHAQGFLRQYLHTWNTQKAIGITTLGFAGFVDGSLEGYGFDGRHSFERKWDADPYGFWGSKSHLKSFVDNDPSKGRKSGFTTWTGVWDFYHAADKSRKVGYITGGFVFGLGSWKCKWKERTKREKWYFVMDVGAAVLVSSTAKNIGMRWVRN